VANLEATFIAPDGFPTTAGALRALIAEMFADASGIRSGKLRGMSVAPAPPDAGFAVTVNEGSAIIPTDDGLGAYFVTQYAPETIPWIPAGGQPRVDSLVLAVADSDYGTIPASLGPVWRVVEGVAAASPVALSDADLAAALGTPGGHLRWIDVEIPPAPQEAITGNLMTARYAEARAGALQTVVIEDAGAEQIPPNPGADMVNISPASITVPRSGKVKITLRGVMTVSADATHRFGFRIEGAATVAFNATFSITTTKIGVHPFCDVNLISGMVPGTTLTVRAVGLTTGGAGSSVTSGIRWILEQLP
jgi:hypothetical protein